VTQRKKENVFAYFLLVKQQLLLMAKTISTKKL
jgi:hypothetical protein